MRVCVFVCLCLRVSGVSLVCPWCVCGWGSLGLGLSLSGGQQTCEVLTTCLAPEYEVLEAKVESAEEEDDYWDEERPMKPTDLDRLRKAIDALEDTKGDAVMLIEAMTLFGSVHMQVWRGRYVQGGLLGSRMGRQMQTKREYRKAIEDLVDNGDA